MVDILDTSAPPEPFSESQVEALSVIRAELLVAVLTAPTLQEVISDARVPASAKAVLNDRIQSQRQLKVLSANRLCQGITMFNYVDTSPGVGEEACGIRIEIFDRILRRFADPYYVILHKPNPSISLLKVLRYTVNPAVPLEALAAQYLPYPDAVSSPSSKEVTNPQDCVKLAKSLRRELIGWQRRKEILQILRETYGISPGALPSPRRTKTNIESIDYTDPQERNMKIKWYDGKVGRMEILSCGRIEKATVVDGSGKRDQRLESILKAGRIADLPDRLCPSD